MSQIPALPQGVAGEGGSTLVVAVNDRLRRISSALDTMTGAMGKQGATGATGASGAVTLETNGVANAVQSLLNLIAGGNITLTADGLGGVTIAAAAASLTPPVTLAAAIPQAILTLEQTGTGTGAALAITAGTSAQYAVTLTGGTAAGAGLLIDESALTSVTALRVKGNDAAAIIATSTTGFGVSGTSGSGNGLYGEGDGAGAGVYGNNTSTGPAVSGHAHTGPGGYFISGYGQGLQSVSTSTNMPAIQASAGANCPSAVAIDGVTMAHLAGFTPAAGWIQFASDAKNLTDDVAVVGSVAVPGGHGALLCYVNGSWRTLC